MYLLCGEECVLITDHSHPLASVTLDLAVILSV